MNKYLNIIHLQKTLSNKEILSGNFGLEKEGLRITEEGKLALTPHPKIFGNKLKNPYITTDFSESQIEIVTPVFNSINEAYQCLSFLVDIVNTSINPNEYIWNHSLPCILPKDEEIPLARYEGKKGEASEQYRIQLAKKYGTKKQMISGIHFNFSIDDNTLRKLYESTNKEKSFKEFKNQVYLKISRNYLRYKWIIIYITGCSIATHKSFTKECINLMPEEDNNESYYSNQAVSFRNSKAGYKNLEILAPSYDSINEFITDIKEFIKDRKISEAKELYSQIRLKPHNPQKYLESLKEDGINYVELRSIDINTFDKCGISKNDMEFVHLFLIYTLIKEEKEYKNWQEEAIENEEIVSEYAFKKGLKLQKNGEKIEINKWIQEIIQEIKQINKTLQLHKEKTIKQIEERIQNPEKSYVKEYIKLIKNKGFVKSQISISKNNKETSKNLVDLETIKNNKKLYEYYTKSLPNQKKI